MLISSPNLSSISIRAFIFFLIFSVSFLASSLLSDAEPQKIHFRFPNLYPEGLAWDPLTQQFFLGSLRQRTIVAVTDAVTAETFIFDSSLPENVSFVGLSVDSINRRLLAVVHAANTLSPFNALAAYDLRSRQRLFLSVLPTADSDDCESNRAIANDVAVDDEGDAYVTNSAGNYIWKVNDEGEASIFSRSPQYAAHPVDRDTSYSSCGLNGIAYVGKGYLLVVQSNTGKMFKVDANDGTGRLVQLSEDLMGADDIALRSDGVVLVVSPVNKLWYLKSEDNWTEGAVFDKINLDLKRFPTSVVVGEGNRAYVGYGYVDEGIIGNSSRQSFSVEEVRSEKSESNHTWRMLALIGVGLACSYITLFGGFRSRGLFNKREKVH
ncbi:uncharacterized protein LOC114751358 [Neltuma alba]|uniref:uncharacterized protein LOC114751358 n=1 Tax=Neltuma alba TaxID=207710 RepID=UPI0010A4729E|nr:uncharacterized protein LOC114751358 [Prosopis alba]